MKNKYEDIIHLPHHKSSKHPHMSRHDRAAQFSPFAALTGHGDAVSEAARVTDKKVELDDYIKTDLNERLGQIHEYIDKKPEVSITYFQEDHLKEGGSYATASGYVKKIDQYKELVVMGDGRKILMSDIIEIDWEGFGCSHKNDYHCSRGCHQYTNPK